MKGLEALKDIFNHIYNKETTYEEDVKLNNEREIIEKELKAFEIIKEKGVNVRDFKEELDWTKFDYEFYACYYRHFSIEELTKDEFNFLKEVIE